MQVLDWAHAGCWDNIGQNDVAYCNVDPDLLYLADIALYDHFVGTEAQ